MKDFTIYPAIDLKDGKCVRLLQGRAEDVTVYGEDPVEQARQWEAQGAQWLHVVDLDGAFQGAPAHVDVIRRITQAISIPIEVGGGIRTDADLQRLQEAGVARMILGTRALEHADELAGLAAKYGTALAVGIDARNGFVQVKGWTETSAVTADELARQVSAAGIQTLIYTDTATDGMLAGPNFIATQAVCRAVGPSCSVTASGGVSSDDDVRGLLRLNEENLNGVIVGKALYEGRVTLRNLLSLAGE